MPLSGHRFLRIVLGLFSLVTALGGLVMIFGGKPLILLLLLGPPTSEVSTLFLLTLKEMGGHLLMLSLLFCFAARDPVRNVAIVDALIAGLCVLVLTPLLSLYTLDVQRLYPGYLIWGRSVIRLAIVALLLYLRPREAASG